MSIVYSHKSKVLAKAILTDDCRLMTFD